MSDLKDRIRRIYEETDDWGHEANRLVELEIGLSLTPTERIRWLEEAQVTFARLQGLLPPEDEGAGESEIESDELSME